MRRVSRHICGAKRQQINAIIHPGNRITIGNRYSQSWFSSCCGNIYALESFRFWLDCCKMMFLNTPPTRRGWLLADKAYCDSEWADTLRTEHGIKIVTPRRQKKGDTLKSGDAYSTAVSLRRKPIESFFNWINSKFHIQTASFVRSSTGLLFHVFANIAAAMLFKLFNSWFAL